MRGKTYLAFMVIALLAVSSIFTVGPVNADEGENSWDVEVDEGTTDRFGGGAYRYFKFSNDPGTDAMFGVIWGTSSNPNSIVMVSTQARYLAQVQVQMTGIGQNEDEKQNSYVKMKSMLGTTIGKIYEYNDSNQNGVVNFVMDEDGKITSELEEVYKYVNLRDAEWTSSELIEEQDGDNTSWEFTLTARNLSYEPVGYSLTPGMDEEVLEYVNFTFHLTAGTREVEDVEMPSFDVEVRKGIGDRRVFRNANRNGSQKVNGVVGDYDMKWDHEIDGWDYEEDNQNPMLVMGFHNMFGNRYPDGPNNWYRRFMHQKLPQEGAKFRTQDGEEDTNFSDTRRFQEKILKQNRIQYGSKWSRVGMFKWESNVTVDEAPDKMTAQIMGGAPIVHIGPFTDNFIGFQIWGGLNYPGGEQIYHDPAQSGSAYLEVTSSTDDDEGPTGPGGILGRPIFMVFVAGLALVIIVTLLYRKSDDSIQRDRYDRETSKEKEEWSDYYDRER